MRYKIGMCGICKIEDNEGWGRKDIVFMDKG